MKIPLTLCFACFALFVSKGHAQDQQTLVDLIGVPVMEGLSEEADARLVFDKPEGRIIHVELSGEPAAGEVLAFYKETLYQLGWALAGERNGGGGGGLIFHREGEQLVLIVTGNAPVRLVIELGPAGEIQG